MASILNPEAPAFVAHLSTLANDGYVVVNKSVYSTTKYPSADSYQLYKTVTSFNIVTGTLKKNLTALASNVLTDLNAVKLQLFNEEYNNIQVSEANDDILDRLDIEMDESTAPSDKAHKVSLTTTATEPAGDSKPEISIVKCGNISMMGAKNISRPQLYFKDKIDNSDSLWVPKLVDKPNNKIPFILKMNYGSDGELLGYDHPYKSEISSYYPPSQFIEPDEEAMSFPSPLECTEYKYIETEEQVDDLVKDLETEYEIAVDLEHHSYRSYQGFTCLIQISTSKVDYIIDALVAREHLHKLNIPFTNPNILKIFHGAKLDVLWLQRDFGVYVVGMFDTHFACKTLNLSKASLQHILMKYCNVQTNKQYQLADWRLRPLPEELITYARIDTHYLIYIWRQMKADLIKKAGGETHLLMSVFEESRNQCETLYKKKELQDPTNLFPFSSTLKRFNWKQKAAFQLLYKWRDEQARNLDESTGFLLPNHMLLSLAEALPREMQNIVTCCQPTPAFVRENLSTIHKIILSCRDMPLESTLNNINSISPMPDERNTKPEPNMLDNGEQPSPHSEETVNMDQANPAEAVGLPSKPTVGVFSNSENDNGASSQMCAGNQDMKVFISPYERYKQYLTLAQVKEKKEYKHKETKIAKGKKGVVKAQASSTSLVKKDQNDTKNVTNQKEIKGAKGKNQGNANAKYNKVNKGKAVQKQ